MIFLQLFYTFLFIGILTFGGGYSMIALIQHEVVDNHHWITAQEYTDILAVSQMTPGPVGINTATYTGYSAVLSAGYPQWAAVGGSLLASLAVVMLPVLLVVLVSRWLLAHKDDPRIATVLRVLRLTVVGLVAAAALQLMPSAFAPTASGGVPVSSLIIFVAVFVASWRFKVSPVLLIVASGIVGLVAFQ